MADGIELLVRCERVLEDLERPSEDPEELRRQIGAYLEQEWAARAASLAAAARAAK